MTKYGCHTLEEPLENELSTSRGNLFIGQVQVERFIEETALVLDLFYPTYYFNFVRVLPILDFLTITVWALQG